MLARIVAWSALIGIVACKDAPRVAIGGADRPDEPPVMVNTELPFRYPAPLYVRRVQGNVMLRLFVNKDGSIVPDSTRVEESSGYSSLDSAAVKGSQDLYFIPAKLHGEPMAVSVLFPVYFRHPEAAPLPGDTVLGKLEEETAKSGKAPAASRKSPPPTRPGTRTP